MNELLNKPVNNRKARPEWAMDDKQLMTHCIGERYMLRFKIAQMYWQTNMQASDIATALAMSRTSVEQIIRRLRAASTDKNDSVPSVGQEKQKQMAPCKVCGLDYFSFDGPAPCDGCDAPAPIKMGDASSKDIKRWQEEGIYDPIED